MPLTTQSSSSFPKARLVQLVWRNGKPPICIPVTVKCSHYALDIEKRKPQIGEHGCKRVLTTKPNPFEGIPRSGWIILSELLYESLPQGFPLSVAIAAESE